MQLLCRVGRGVRLAERNEVELVAFCTYTTEYMPIGHNQNMLLINNHG